MLKTILVGSLLAFAVTANPLPAAFAQEPEVIDRAEVQAIIRSYLLENPELIEEVQQALEEKRRVEEAQRSAEALERNADLIFNSENQAIIGNPDGDVTVVEFFDYNCGFCQRAMNDMNTLLGEDDNIRFVLKELPILGPGSVSASRFSTAVYRLFPTRYEEFHNRLLGLDAPKDGSAASDDRHGYGTGYRRDDSGDRRSRYHRRFPRGQHAGQRTRRHRHAVLRHRQRGRVRCGGGGHVARQDRQHARMRQHRLLMSRPSLHVLNGPNLNLLGTREASIYGTTTLADIESQCRIWGEANGFDLTFAQSNHEGALVEMLHAAGESAAGVVLNAAAYTHTSIALHDAVRAIDVPVVEVHLSNIHAREAFRHHSTIASACLGQIAGFGPASYTLALQALVGHLQGKNAAGV